MNEKVILQFTCMHSTKYGAVETYFREIVRLCRERGYKTVLQYETLPQSEDYRKDISKDKADFLVRSIPIGFFSSFLGVWQVIRTVKPDIIHVHFAERFVKMWIPLLGRLLGAKRIICTVHNIPEYKGKTWSRHIYNLYDKVMAVSKSAEEGCLTGGVDRAKLVTHYLGIFGNRERNAELRLKYRNQFQIPEDAIVLACIAFDTPFKGLDILLEAFHVAARECPQLHLIQIGVDPEASQLPQLAADLKISDKVHWAGILDEGWRVLNAADIYLQTSRFSEGLGLAIVEAMALKLPVIGTNVGGIPEAVLNDVTGAVIQPDAQSVAAAILKMVGEKDRWQTMGTAGNARYQDVFNGKRSVAALVEEYYRLGPKLA